MSFKHIVVPKGDKVPVQNGKLHVPDNPIIAYIEGDGIGPDITRASKRSDAAVGMPMAASAALPGWKFTRVRRLPKSAADHA
jgi:hypothetical protein